MYRLWLPSGPRLIHWAAISALCRDALPALEFPDHPTADHARLEDDESGRWIAFVSGKQSLTRAAQAVVQGAAAVLLAEEMTEQDFEDALEALAGEATFFIPPGLLRQLAADAVAPATDVPSALTSRELEVLALVARGCSNSEIASGLHISVNTVRTHIHALRRKLDAPNRAHLVSTAWRLGLSGGSPE